MLSTLRATSFPIHLRPRPPRLPRRATAVAGAALVIAVATHLAAGFAAQPGLPGQADSAAISLPGTGPIDPLAASRQRIDGAIAVWTGNLDRDSGDFIAALHLGELYLARASTTGQAADLERALDAARRALAIDNGLVAGRLLLAQALLATHDFAAAQATAEALLADHPGLPQALATLGDARLERGDYGGAAEAYRQLSETNSGPPVIARRARLAAVTGSLDAARELAAEALALATADPATDAVNSAWYHVLSGALAFQAGDIPAARASFEAAVTQWPGSAAALSGLARTLAATGETDQAIELYAQAAALYPLPETLAALGDLYALAGRADDSAAQYEQVRALAAIDAEAGLPSRGVILFLANHGESSAQAVALAEADVATRPDVYALDAYAWALHAAGDDARAQVAIEQARAYGTEDALLDYHAGMIAAALGRNADAKLLLEVALARNPAFDPLQAQRARATLESLAAGE